MTDPSTQAVLLDLQRAVALLEGALDEIADWYNPEGMGTANWMAGIAVEALDELDALRTPKEPTS
jgi:hypothetical protein